MTSETMCSKGERIQLGIVPAVILSSLVAILLQGCMLLSTPSITHWDVLVQTDHTYGLCEAVFRFQFENNGSRAGARASHYFLSVGGQAADEDLLKRFKHHRPPVAPGNLFEVGDGILFDLEKVHRVSRNRFLVYGTYYEDPKVSAGSVYTVERRRGAWFVVEERCCWVS